MSSTSEMLFNYLRDILYDTRNATLDVEKLDEEYVMLGKGLVYFAQCFTQYNELAIALAKGDFGFPLPPPENELAAPLKSLHSNLRHLTWQSQQVAKGDYKQRVDFMGEFAEAFNTMVEQLADRQQKLEEEIELGRKKTKALEQSNQLLGNITQYIPQQIFVMDVDKQEILLMNDMAKHEIEKDAGYLTKLIELLPERKYQHENCSVEIQYTRGDGERYLRVNAYSIEWNKLNAEAFVINDISDEKIQRKELEIHAYQDTMTHLYNRYYGMRMLDKWLEEKKWFVLIFVDLDCLKFINDKYGHGEGDNFIINAAKHLKTLSSDAVISRLGGDEFMLLVPNISYDKAQACMDAIYFEIQNDEYLKDKEYFYSISFGIVSVGEDNKLSANEVLSLADERMYEHKRIRKKNRLA